ncbi:hypothetical protein E1A91_D03G199400v1 [Gossypium mustelinum]|uniref:Uncharacterized protein n=1 Tax=Gossypium mustelinum TaxID=34275 RepID=A0A5D2VQM7_GOSMU|nr:hypothetical protein E1A91_D03G199400v1 [Gossypium mustelinum]
MRSYISIRENIKSRCYVPLKLWISVWYFLVLYLILYVLFFLQFVCFGLVYISFYFFLRFGFSFRASVLAFGPVPSLVYGLLGFYPAWRLSDSICKCTVLPVILRLYLSWNC